MANYIDIYLRDGKQISKSEWFELLRRDLDIEINNSGFIGSIFTAAVYTDIQNGRDVDLNGYLYQQRTDIIYDSAHELLEDLITDGEYDTFIDILRSLTEVQLRALLSKSDSIDKQDGKLIIKAVEE